MITAAVSVSLGNLIWVSLVAAISALIGGVIGAFFGYMGARLVLQRQRS